MPPVSELIEREDGDDSGDEDEVVVGGVTQDYRCPLTLVLMVDPLTSYVNIYSMYRFGSHTFDRKTCGHSFSAEGIREYLDNSPVARKKCPTSGCNKVLGLKDLHPNKEFAKKARDAARRERMRVEEHDDDDEEVIE
jgi:SUMO ligase MMS21 Smc5/6 complex component